MDNVEHKADRYRFLMSLDPKTEDTDHLLGLVGELTDVSSDLGKAEGMNHAISAGEDLFKHVLAPNQQMLLNYFLGNAWDGLRQISRGNTDKLWDWEQDEIERSILHYRKALNYSEHSDLPKSRKCQILTNLANALDHVGRFVEAISLWDAATSGDPAFAMALGNRGLGLSNYGMALTDAVHRSLFLKGSHEHLKRALTLGIEEHSKVTFTSRMQAIERLLKPEYLEKDLDLEHHSLGSNEEEVRYRKWCLKNRLFLNPLNDLGTFSIASGDVLNVPSIAQPINEGPYFHGYLNQIKQEFVSARCLYYEGTEVPTDHFSDKGILLFDTLDYPVYSMSTEKTKAAFRMMYSLFDKVAFFLNAYLQLHIQETNVTFKTIWYRSQTRKKGIRKEFASRKNWPMRGLFWVSKDLFENRKDFVEALDPDSRQLDEIRHQLEHKYLKLHDSPWSPELYTSGGLAERIAFSIRRDTFERMTMNLMKLVREALIYLTLAVILEERNRASADTKTNMLQTSLRAIQKS
jgi:tetratricopeptide (TPR) repeat protein